MIDLRLELAKNYSTQMISEANSEILLQLPQTLSYFAGHFPQFPVLPAVGFIDISTYLLQSIWPEFANRQIKKVEHLKMKAPVAPNQTIRIQIIKQDANSFLASWKIENGKEIAELDFTFAP